MTNTLSWILAHFAC